MFCSLSCVKTCKQRTVSGTKKIAITVLKECKLKYTYSAYIRCEPGKLSRYSYSLRAGRSGIESRGRRYFPHASRPALGPTQPPIQWVPGLSPGVKRPGRGVDHPPPSSAEVKERVELQLYSSWPVLGWNLPLPLHSLRHYTAILGSWPWGNTMFKTNNVYPIL
jgi:hypothetical protein